MNLSNYIIIIFFFILISCKEKGNDSYKLYGKWQIIENTYYPKTIVFKNKTQEIIFNNVIKKLNNSFQNLKGKYIIFNKDSTFYSQEQPNSKSYWLFKNNNQIIFSKSKDTFIQNYTYGKVQIIKNKLILTDYQKNGDSIKMTLIKWQK